MIRQNDCVTENFVDFLHNTYKILCNLKEKCDVAEFLKDLHDIVWLLSACKENDARIYLKLDELDYKYGWYMQSISYQMRDIFFPYLHITNREKLIIYLQNLPMIILFKLGGSRIVNRFAERQIFGYIK